MQTAQRSPRTVIAALAVGLGRLHGQARLRRQQWMECRLSRRVDRRDLQQGCSSRTLLARAPRPTPDHLTMPSSKVAGPRKRSPRLVLDVTG